MKRPVPIFRKSLLRILLITTLAAGFAHHASAQNSEPVSSLSLMPVPQKLQILTGKFRLDAGFHAVQRGFLNQRLEQAVDRNLHRISLRTNLDFTPAKITDPASALFIEVEQAGEEVQGPDEDESYSLDINPRRCILLSKTVVGAIRGLETLQQLISADSNGFFLPAVKIEDRPRFPWRGLLVDVSRRWQPVDFVKRTLDDMAVVKLNVFHWHLSDDQGFRVESKVFPLLHERGSDGQFYTQQQIREIVAYARDRGIRILPEFDLPAHAQAILVAYPELASLPGTYEFTHDMVVTSVNVDPTREATYLWVDKFVEEMAALFPDRYWHIGGDEVDGESWDKSEHVQKFMKDRGIKSNAELQAYFNARLAVILDKHGKRMVGWDEILRPDLRRDVVVQSWQGSDSLAASAKLGFDGILSAPYYLDKMLTSAAYYSADPLPAGSNLTESEAKHILGGEVCAWGQLTSEENIDSRIWPYSAAVAERFWSPREITNTKDMYRRLDKISIELESVGSLHRVNQEIMLRRAVGGNPPEFATKLLGLIQPPRLGLRMKESTPSQLSPLTALSDIAVADPAGARIFSDNVDAFLKSARKNQSARAKLRAEFQFWRELDPAIARFADFSPVFRDALPVSVKLAELGKIGDEAVEFISIGKRAPQEWETRQIDLLKQCVVPQKLLVPAICPAMKKLVEAAGTP